MLLIFDRTPSSLRGPVLILGLCIRAFARARECASSASLSLSAFVALCTADASGHVRFWHFSSGTCLHTTDDQRSQTMSLAFSPHGDRYATVGSDPQVYLYDVETKKRVTTLDATSVYICLRYRRYVYLSAIARPHTCWVARYPSWV